MALISLRHLGKRYGAIAVVNDVCLDIAHGELVAFVGPSGCGKTTTLRMIAGLTDVSEGTILFDSEDVTDQPTYRRNTGMVFQGYALFPHMTVAQNIAFGLEMRGIRGSEAMRLVDEALDLVRLKPQAERQPRQLSGGQQQRVALARAIVVKPDALLLDEPLSALDAQLRHEVRLDIRRLQRTLGLTTILVTHDQEEAVSIADRIVVMNGGRVEQIGSPQEVYEHPHSRFVAQFIGVSNLLAGAIEAPGQFRTKGGALLRFGNGQVAVGGDSLAHVPEKWSPVFRNGHAPIEVTSADPGSFEPGSALVVRPEKIEIGSELHDSRNSITGVVETVSYLGALTEIAVRLPSGETLTAHRQNRHAEDARRFRPGEAATVSWAPEAGFVL
jgi:putative spermidine/putrescine transport system ATP-binding protein